MLQSELKNLNKVIDMNYYPVKEPENSNFRHRPVGLGVQGLADAFILLRLPFTSDKAKELNQEILKPFTILALNASVEEAKKMEYMSLTKVHLFQRRIPAQYVGVEDEDLSGRWDWKKLRKMY